MGREQKIDKVTTTLLVCFLLWPQFSWPVGFKLFTYRNDCYVAQRSCMCWYFSKHCFERTLFIVFLCVVFLVVLSYSNVIFTAINSANMICISPTGTPRYGAPVLMDRLSDGILWHSRQRRRWECQGARCTLGWIITWCVFTPNMALCVVSQLE